MRRPWFLEQRPQMTNSHLTLSSFYGIIYLGRLNDRSKYSEHTDTVSDCSFKQGDGYAKS